MKPNNKNLIHFFFAHLRALDFYKASTLCNEFTIHKFATLELGFDTHVMITCFMSSVDTILVSMLQSTPCYIARLRKKKYLDANIWMR